LRSFPPQASAAKNEETLPWRNTLSGYAWPFTLFSYFYWLQASSDRWSLETYADTAAVGHYLVLFQLGYQPVTLLFAMACQLATPILFAHVGDAADSQRVRKTQRINMQIVIWTLGLTVFATAAASLFHGLVLRLFTAADFRNVSYLLPVMVLSGGIFAAGQAASLLISSGNDTRQLIAPKIGTALLGVAFNFLGARWYGMAGVAWASVAFSVSYLAAVLLVVSRSAERPISSPPESS
jgi:O-antigen/teichoic acid export membrane protein